MNYKGIDYQLAQALMPQGGTALSNIDFQTILDWIRKYPDQLEEIATDEKPLPTSDPWGKPYKYNVAEDGKSFTIRTGTETETTEDDVVYDSKIGDFLK